MTKIAVIPSDSLESYKKGGISSWLQDYYNPKRFFEEVFLLSPLENDSRTEYGMTIIPTRPNQLKKRIKELGIDIVRAYGGYWPADMACYNRVAGVPVVVSIHDARQSMFHPSVKYADVVICTSKKVETLALSMGVIPQRTRILPNRIDMDIFKPFLDKSILKLENHQIPSGKHILHVGRKSTEKNIDTIIKALKYLPKEYSCVFVGQGNIELYVDLAKKSDVSDRCFWIESIANNELPRWYSWCDCMCTPSRSEGFGIVFIEAAACGAAIVTSDIPPMNEYLKNDISACLVKNIEDPHDIALAIQKVCENDAYRKKISAGAINAASRFDKKTIDDEEIEIYKDALKIKNSIYRKVQLTLGAYLHI